MFERYGAINGYLTDPADMPEVEKPALPERFAVNDNLILKPEDFKVPYLCTVRTRTRARARPSL